MPALTHNRVKNGFNGGIRKKNATTGTVKSRILGMRGVDGNRKKDLIGGIGSLPTNIRRAYTRRANCSCKTEPYVEPIFLNTPDNFAELDSEYVFLLKYSHQISTRYTSFEIVEKPDWLNLVSSNIELKKATIKGTPLLADLTNTYNLKIKLIDNKGVSVTRNFKIKVYKKVFNVSVSNNGVTPRLNYYRLSNYNGNSINLGEIMQYDTGATAIYRFNLSDPTNVNHPLRLSNINGVKNTLSSDITVNGTAGEEGAYIDFVSNNQTNYIYCTHHGFGMGVFYQPINTLTNITTFNTVISSNAYVINNNSSLVINLAYKAAYLFNLSDSSNDNYQLLLKKTDDVNGEDYSNYYLTGTPGTDGLIGLVINNNLQISIQEKTNVNYGSNYNSTINISSSNNSGTILISGVFKQDKVITSTIVDVDGVPNDSEITYQWTRDGNPIPNANNNQYTIVSEDYGTIINLNAKYIDNLGYNEDITSTNTTVVEDTPGILSLLGIDNVNGNNELIVNKQVVANLVDPDGNGVNNISNYQWIKSANSDMSSPANITGANGFSYTPIVEDIGSYINIIIDYTDNKNNSYSDVTSVDTFLVEKEVDLGSSVVINGLLQDGNTVTALLTDLNKINIGETVDFTWSKSSSGVVTQLKTVTITNNTLGETLESTYTLLNTDIGARISISVAYTDRGGNEYSVGGNNLVTFTTGSLVEQADQINPVLTAVEQVSTPNINTTPSFIFNTNEAGTINSNKTITTPANGLAVVGNNTIVFAAMAVGTYSDVYVTVTDVANNTSSQLELDSFEIVASSSNGVVTVSGTEQVGETLTASVSDDNVSDINNVTIAYQWKRNNSGTITNIGTDSNNYTLTNDDEGNKISVTATYTDDVGNNESVTSSETGDVIGIPPQLITGANIASSINPTPSFSFTSDKPGTISSNYNLISSVVAVNGNNSVKFSSLGEGTYTDIWVKVTAADGSESSELPVPDFTVETLDLALQAGLSQTNDGTLDISGICRDGEILEVKIYDSDGGSISGNNIKWYRVSGEKPNETVVEVTPSPNFTYTLSNSDLGFRIKASAEYTDNNSENESMTTWNTQVITEKTSLSLDAASGSYRFDTHGTTDHPTLTFERGTTYTISLNNSTTHPFRIQTNSQKDGDLYNDGLSHGTAGSGSDAQNQTDGTLTFTVPYDAPDTLYYRCQVHASMVGTINIVSNQLKIYYSDANLRPVINESTIILESLFKRFKKDYNVVVETHPKEVFGSVSVIADASYSKELIRINQEPAGSPIDLTGMATLNDKPVISFVNTFVHELFHIFELVGTQNKDLYDITSYTNHHVYVGTDGLAGYKELITANETTLASTPHSKTLDIENMVGVPIEDDFGEGTHLYHWEEGLHQNSDGSTTDEPRSYDNGSGSKDYPILTNEIMTGIKDLNDKYLTTMTTGALKDVGHDINDTSEWVTKTGTNMNWK